MHFNIECKGCFAYNHCYLQEAYPDNKCPCKTCLVKGVCRPIDTCDARKDLKYDENYPKKSVDVNNVYRDIE